MRLRVLSLAAVVASALFLSACDSSVSQTGPVPNTGQPDSVKCQKISTVGPVFKPTYVQLACTDGLLVSSPPPFTTPRGQLPNGVTLKGITVTKRQVRFTVQYGPGDCRVVKFNLGGTSTAKPVAVTC